MKVQASIDYTFATTSLGEMLLATTQNGVCALYLADTIDGILPEFESKYPVNDFAPHHPVLQSYIEKLNSWLKQPSEKLDIPLDFHRGTHFQVQVWKALLAIPSGQTRSYTDVAISIGNPLAVRAVASACARNEISLIVPCHRVVRASGVLAGYRWGLKRKEQLLVQEKLSYQPSLF